MDGRSRVVGWRFSSYFYRHPGKTFRTMEEVKNAFVCTKPDQLGCYEIELSLSANLHSLTLIHLHPFSRNKAVGFTLVSAWARLEKFYIYGSWVKLNCWWPIVNSIPSDLLFNGWIAIHILPFHLWKEEIFELIGSLCSGLEEIDPKTKSLYELSVACLKVKNHGVHSIPRPIAVLDRNVWFLALVVVEKTTKLSAQPAESSRSNGPQTHELSMPLDQPGDGVGWLRAKEGKNVAGTKESGEVRNRWDFALLGKSKRKGERKTTSKRQKRKLVQISKEVSARKFSSTLEV
uniref:DUF4283 domain-containing protein n=1 Tax=Nelumbo nucifera TaxID=4432 RepID=A0A822XAJ4_NELNU|nr:TPA_asm: hypothetical protein HUJ06_019917 [Nelumbo nucifera]